MENIVHLASFFKTWGSRIGEGNGNPLQCSCLENPRDGGAWWATVYRVAQSRTRLKRLSSSSSSVCKQRRQWHPTPVLLPGKSYGQGSLVGCSPWGREELDIAEWLHFHALEKEMATHSSILAWRIPGTVKPGGLPSMGWHRVGHDLSDLAAAASVKHLAWCLAHSVKDHKCYLLPSLTEAYNNYIK